MGVIAVRAFLVIKLPRYINFDFCFKLFVNTPVAVQEFLVGGQAIFELVDFDIFILGVRGVQAAGAEDDFWDVPLGEGAGVGGAGEDGFFASAGGCFGGVEQGGNYVVFQVVIHGIILVYQFYGNLIVRLFFQEQVQFVAALLGGSAGQVSPVHLGGAAIGHNVDLLTALDDGNGGGFVAQLRMWGAVGEFVGEIFHGGDGSGHGVDGVFTFFRSAAVGALAAGGQAQTHHAAMGEDYLEVGGFGEDGGGEFAGQGGIFGIG